MKLYKAKKEGSQIYLKDSDQMDRYLEKGCDIYEENEDGSNTLIATPEKGYLVEKPFFPIPQVIRN